MNGDRSTENILHDATIPDPEELDEREVGELRSIPPPDKSRVSIRAGGDGPDDEDVDENVELDDDLPASKKEDLTQGDEGIDDPITVRNR
jgi:hypothetical protein